ALQLRLHPLVEPLGTAVDEDFCGCLFKVVKEAMGRLAKFRQRPNGEQRQLQILVMASHEGGVLPAAIELNRGLRQLAPLGFGPGSDEFGQLHCVGQRASSAWSAMEELSKRFRRHAGSSSPSSRSTNIRAASTCLQ